MIRCRITTPTRTGCAKKPAQLPQPITMSRRNSSTLSGMPIAWRQDTPLTSSDLRSEQLHATAARAAERRERVALATSRLHTEQDGPLRRATHPLGGLPEAVVRAIHGEALFHGDRALWTYRG